MSIGVGLFFIAVGAILAFAVNDRTVGNFDLSAIGVILMLVGVVGTSISMLIWNKYGAGGRRARLIERDLPGGRVVEREVPPGRVVERETPVGRVLHVDSTRNGATERIIERDIPPPPEERVVEEDVPRRRRRW